MSVASRVNDLATAVGNYLRDSVRPRLLPAGGIVGSVLAKTSATDFQAAWVPSYSVPVTLNVTIAPAAYGVFNQTIAYVGVTPTSEVFAWLAPNIQFDADDLNGTTVIATPLSGQIKFTLLSEGPIAGTYSINYQVLL